MSVLALEAATRIQAALVGLGPEFLPSAAGLRSCPAPAADPGLAGPVLVPRSALERRALRVLAAAGGPPLREAAAVLGQRCGAAIGVDELSDLVEEWVPGGSLDPDAAALTRRLLCDLANLAARPRSSHAATVEALAGFARAAAGLADDAGLIDEDALAAHAARSGWGSSFDGLCEATGLARVLGRLALHDNRVAQAKSALLELGRPADAAEAAELAGRDERSVSLACSTCASIVRAGSKLWAACEHKQRLAFAADAAALADDAGLIDEDALMQLAASRGHGGGVDDVVAGCRLVRVFGHVAESDSTSAAAKAVLLSLARPATAQEVAGVVGRNADAVAAAFASCRSVVPASRRCWAAHPDPVFADAVDALVALADDSGLVDEARLVPAVEAVGWAGTVEELAQRCGCVRVGGRLALEATNRAAALAALLNLGGAATTEEVANEAGLSDGLAAASLRACSAVGRRRGGRYRLVSGGEREPYDISRRAGRLRRETLAALRRRAVEECADDAGLICEQRLAEAAAGLQATTGEIIEACGLKRVRDRLAVSDSTAAAVKAAMEELARPVSVAEIADLTARTPKSVAHAFAETPSIVRVGRKRWRLDAVDGALGVFAAAAMDLRDDVGLIDEEQLRRVAASLGCGDRCDDLAAMCGFARLSGKLAVDPIDRAAVKAALLALGRPASPKDIAKQAGLTNDQVHDAVATIESLVPVGPAMWAAQETLDGAFAEFAAVVVLCRDDVGLIDEDRLQALASEHDWPAPLDDLIAACGLVRLSGRLAVADTAVAAAKAALLDRQQPLTLHQLQEMTGHTYSAIANSFARCASIQRITRGKRDAAGAFNVI